MQDAYDRGNGTPHLGRSWKEKEIKETKKEEK
jgi:hypothetical protein